MWPNPQETADLITFTEEIHNRKLHFCGVLQLTVWGFHNHQNITKVKGNIFWGGRNDRRVFNRVSHPTVFCKNVFWNICQHSQENTCANVFFKTAVLQLYQKTESCISDFLWILWNVSKQLFLQKNCEKLEISLNLKDFTGFLQIEMFTKLLFFQSFSSRNICHPPCYLKCTLFRLENYLGFSRFALYGQLHWLEDTKRNVLNVTVFRNQVHHRKYLRE